MSTGGGGYGGAYPVDVVVGDQQLRVTVHFAEVDGQATCVGLDVRSFTSPIGFEPPVDWRLVVPIGGKWTTITSPLMRGVRVAQSIEKAAESAESVLAGVLEQLTGRSYTPERARDEAGVQWQHHEPAKRRGPKPLLDDALLRDVVARAYRSSPSKPVQAVREAMAREVPVYKGKVSSDVARKAVASARARGFIPPAKRSGK